MYNGAYSTVDEISLWQKLALQELAHFDRKSLGAQSPNTYLEPIS